MIWVRSDLYNRSTHFISGNFVEVIDPPQGCKLRVDTTTLQLTSEDVKDRFQVEIRFFGFTDRVLVDRDRWQRRGTL